MPTPAILENASDNIEDAVTNLIVAAEDAVTAMMAATPATDLAGVVGKLDRLKRLIEENANSTPDDVELTFIALIGSAADDLRRFSGHTHGPAPRPTGRSGEFVPV